MAKASVCRRSSPPGWKNAKIGGEVSSCLTAENAASWSASQINSSVCFMRGRSGVPTDNRDENSLHWLTRPRNDLRSVRLDGVGKSRMAAVFAGSTVKPAEFRM